MKIPPLIITAAILFWGVESGHLLISLLVAGIAAGAVYLPVTWNLSDEDSVSVFDLTSVIFLAASTIIFLNVDKLYFLKTIVIWLPPILLPPLVAQLSSGRERLVIGTRFGFKKNKVHKRTTLDFKIQYLATCLLATAMANSRSSLFFPCAAGLVFWLLYVNRGRAFSSLTFVVAFCFALATGYVGFKGAETVHDYVSQKTRRLIRGYFYSRYADPFQARLSFGSIGRLKQSGDVVLRLTTDDATPILLRQGAYESFKGHSWYSAQQFQYVPYNNAEWNILPEPDAGGKKATIDFYLPREKGLLPHPGGSYRVRGEMLYELEKKEDGIIKIVDGAPLVTYDIYYEPSLYSEKDLPTEKNLVVHEEDDRVLEQVVQNWAVETMSRQQRLQKIKEFFGDGFTYTLRLYGKGTRASALENFLLETRNGYCELYATATALLLRKLEIPSRYVTGFVADERGWLEDKLIVRERHAHAWCEAYVDGRWLVVDTTPPDWFALENKRISGLERVKDIFSFLRLKYDQYQIQTELNFRGLFSLLALILAIILAFRIYRRMGKKIDAAAAGSMRKTFEQVDSPLYEVEDRLEKLGGKRMADESLSEWLLRLDREQGIDLERLEELLVLHNRLRFDPVGLTESEMASFNSQAQEWLAAHPEQDSTT